MTECIAYCKMTCRNWAVAGSEFCQSCLDRHYEYKAAFDAAKKARQASFEFEGDAICTVCAARYPPMTLHKCTLLAKLPGRFGDNYARGITLQR